MSYILAQIQWKVHCPADCSFDTPNGVIFVAKLDITQLNQVLSHTTRSFLLRKIPNRQDHGVVPEDRQIDIHLSRLLLDNSFAKDSLHQFVQPYLGLLPVNVDHASNILRQILTGRIFTGARLKAAGLASSCACPSCGNQEDHDHAEYDNIRPPLDILPYDLSWSTGIILAPIVKFDFPDFLAEMGQDPSPPVLAHGFVFIDGSCFIHDWARVRAASSAVFIPNQLECVVSLPGSFLTSQRAEIFALAVAVCAASGPVIIASDCSNVVRMFAFLKQNSFHSIALKAVANKDLWSLVIELARRRDAPVHVFKVKAHVSHNDPQDPHLTFGNTKADLLAKKHAWRAFEQCSAGCRACISEAIALQAHMVSAFHKRADLLKHVQATAFELDDPSLGMGPFSRKIHCTSRNRCRTKTKVCQVCQLFETRDCLETVAISEYHAGGIARLTLDLLRSQNPTFSSKSFSERIPPINLRLPGVDQIHRKGRQAPAEVEEVVRFTQHCHIMFSRNPTGPCVPWTLVFLRLLFYVPPIKPSHSISNTASCSVCFSFSICANVAVARSPLHPIVPISNLLVWVKLRDFLVPSAPGLKVPVGLGF